jgi:hypothetical protein
MMAGDFELKTLERPWKGNKRNESCIPEGVYLIKRDKAGRHRWWSVQNVTGRSAIEFHEGQLPTHSDGCVLIGARHDPYFNLHDCGVGLNALLRHVGNNDFMLTIRRYCPHIDA